MAKVKYPALSGLAFRDKIVSILMLVKNIISKTIDFYFLDNFLQEKMLNDTGASFTQIIRKDNKIIKKAKEEGEQKLRDEINWYLFFKNSKFSKHLPKIYSYSTKPGNTYLTMKYYNYPNFRRIIISDINSLNKLKKRWKFMMLVLKKYLYSY